jgi:hypothetical protein
MHPLYTTGHAQVYDLVLSSSLNALCGEITSPSVFDYGRELEGGELFLPLRGFAPLSLKKVSCDSKLGGVNRRLRV